ncbi:hypothetical protein BWQ96_01979 [Gracilariopsis chorda]|uniref:Sas10 C-terminal domain-containing protein n=1 Tax=Gracilariopsis chorda TaxID=448386 RepID=A0A2V3J4J2_9FLOR|nr:hypothetical protein BWQ96_01979 [Gracilariopsis chorda]|eukprot:PXF48290.1 hypothetical protein BWQ96_01979 [Gracilariopsis chorda]
MVKKTKRPLLSGRGFVDDRSGDDDLNDEQQIKENDEVDDFFEQRHYRMLQKVREEESDSDEELEPELTGQEVMNIHSSDSEDSVDEDEDDDDLPGDPEEEKKGWGSKRRHWYGGDTHEFEIMEEDERDQALKDEEEEALRMQKKALQNLKPEDFRDDDEDESGTEPEKNDSDVAKEAVLVSTSRKEISEDMMDAIAPEVPMLVREMVKSHKEAQVWFKKVKLSETARIIYHLHSSFVTNIAYYLSLRTDPEAEGVVDIRTHPVLVRIYAIRALLEKASGLSIPGAVEAEPVTMPSLEGDERAGDDEREKESQGIEETPSGAVDHGDPIPPNEQERMNGVLSDNAKKTKKKRNRRKRKRAELTIEEDEERVKALLSSKRDDSGTIGHADKRAKKRKLQTIINQMESQRKNEEVRRIAPADEELVRDKRGKEEKETARSSVIEGQESERTHEEDDDEVMQRMVAKKEKKEARLERRMAAAEPHVYRFKDKADPDGKRKASSEIVKNKGLTRYRSRKKKTPRTKNRLAYASAVKRRKGAVREYAGKPGIGYSGEASGINMSARKGSRLSEV